MSTVRRASGVRDRPLSTAVARFAARAASLAVLAVLATVGMVASVHVAVAQTTTTAPRPDAVAGAVPLPSSLSRAVTEQERRVLRTQTADAAAPSTTRTPLTTTTPLPTSTRPSTTQPARPSSTSTTVRPTTTRPTTTTTRPTTTTTTTSTLPPGAVSVRGDGRLLARVVLADGAFTFDPPTPAARTRMRRGDAAYKARLAVSKTARTATADVFFALFSSPTPSTRDPKSGAVTPVFDRRPVWVVHYREVTSSRAAPIRIPARNHGSTTTVVTTTTTTAPPPRTDIVIVYDDKTGAQILRSEYASPPTTAPPTATTRP